MSVNWTDLHGRPRQPPPAPPASDLTKVRCRRAEEGTIASNTGGIPVWRRLPETLSLTTLKTTVSTTQPTPSDLDLLRRTVDLSHIAVSRGNKPYAALLADPRGRVVAEAHITESTSGDPTAHAEINLIRLLKQLDSLPRKALTLYTNCQPNALCVAAILCSGISRVLYAYPHPSADTGYSQDETIDSTRIIGPLLSASPAPH